VVVVRVDLVGSLMEPVVKIPLFQAGELQLVQQLVVALVLMERYQVLMVDRVVVQVLMVDHLETEPKVRVTPEVEALPAIQEALFIG
jgi:hypothetical protein